MCMAQPARHPRMYATTQTLHTLAHPLRLPFPGNLTPHLHEILKQLKLSAEGRHPRLPDTAVVLPQRPHAARLQHSHDGDRDVAHAGERRQGPEALVWLCLALPDDRGGEAARAEAALLPIRGALLTGRDVLDQSFRGCTATCKGCRVKVVCMHARMHAHAQAGTLWEPPPSRGSRAPPRAPPARPPRG